jgi:hypothetical protein
VQGNTDITEVERVEGASFVDVEDVLEGRVFHVTRRESWAEIAAAGEIRPNVGGTLFSTFGFSSNSYFRNRGCVSVFDYRIAPNEEIRMFRARCSPFQPAEPGGLGIAVLLLKDTVYQKLIPWSRSKEDGVSSEMVVPYVESGHPGPISIVEIERIIFFRLTENSSSLAAALRRSRKRI